MRAFSAVILAAWETWCGKTAIYAANPHRVGQQTGESQSWHEDSTEW